MAGKLEVCGVSHGFYTNSSRPRDFLEVLQGLTFQVNPGEVLGIIGPSGCGKTTILNLIAGFIPTQEGTIVLDGTPVHKPSGQRVMISQEQDLFLWMSALDNVAFGLEARGMPKEKRRALAHQYLCMVGLSDFGNHYPYQLSGGMKQRVALARALAVEPLVLLMDEPFGALDSQSRKELQDEMVRLWALVKPTTILITHDVEEAVYLSDRLLVLSQRPAHILEVIQVDLPKPREPELRNSRKAIDLKKHIESMLKS